MKNYSLFAVLCFLGFCSLHAQSVDSEKSAFSVAVDAENPDCIYVKA